MKDTKRKSYEKVPCSNRPIMSKGSNKIARKKFENEMPIYYKNLIKDKQKQNKLQNRKNLQEQTEINECSFRPKINIYSPNRNSCCDSQIQLLLKHLGSNESYFDNK